MTGVLTMMTTGATISQPSCHSEPRTRRKEPPRRAGSVSSLGARVSATGVGPGSSLSLLGQFVVRVHHLPLGPRLGVLGGHLVVDDLLDHVRQGVLGVLNVEQPRLRRCWPFANAADFGDLLHL